MNYIFSAIFLYFFFGLLLYIFQRRIVFNTSGYPGHPKDYNLFLTREIFITTDDNIDLLSWLHIGDKDLPLLIYFHGNSFHIGDRAHRIEKYIDQNWNIILVSWRGFGGNKGKPTEQGLYEDARSAIKWLIEKGILEENIIIYGESLGTGIATEIAQNKKYAGVILESPFTSMVAAAKSKYPIFPVKLLLKDKYESDKKIKNIKSPILIMHGEVDKIVPFWMGKKMFELANNPKYSYFPKNDDHMLEYNDDLINSIKSFLKSLN